MVWGEERGNNDPAGGDMRDNVDFASGTQSTFMKSRQWNTIMTTPAAIIFRENIFCRTTILTSTSLCRAPLERREINQAGQT